jgi:hypothetical protein
VLPLWRKYFTKFYNRNFDLISKFKSDLKTPLRQGISQPDFYGDVVYKLRKILDHCIFSVVFTKIIKRFIKMGFSSTVSIFPSPLPLLFISFIYPPSPNLLSPSPVPFDFIGLLFNHLFVFFSSLSVTDYFFLCLILVVNLHMLCLVPCPVFVWGPSWLLATGSCCWIVWGLRSLNAAYPCWSCLSYFTM